ncbi:PARP6, partial [Symbiodinium sp. CCMP2456]
ILYDSSGRTLSWFSEWLEPEGLQPFQVADKEGLIFELEVFAAVQGAIDLLSERKHLDVVLFTDNQAALSCLISGRAEAEGIASISLQRLLDFEESHDINFWFEWDGLLWVEGEGTEHKTLGKAAVQGGPVQWRNGAIKFAANELAHCVLPWSGYGILPVDWGGNKHRSFAHTLQLDLRKDSTWSFIRRVFECRRVVWVHIAPPCGTASRARSIGPGPRALRSLLHPRGLPGLTEKDQARVDSANLIYDNTADFCKWLLRTIPETGFTVENPLHSWMWQLPSFQDLQQQCSFVSFDACRHGAEDDGEHISRFFVFGVYRSPESFLREASMLKHPFDVARALPDGMVRALFKVLVEGPVAVIKTRLNLLKLWRSWARELEPAESKLRASMAPSVRQVLSGKRTLLLQRIADFWDGASVLRDSLWEKVASHKVQDYSQALWDITMDEADSQGKGWLQGPLSKAQLDAMFPEGWSPCRRFAVWQGKWRPIDDFSECGINACFGCFERISLKALDEITWACVQIFKCAVVRGDVSFTLQDGSVLKGKLHSAWHDADRVRPLSKTYDLKAAYKQMPLHPDERRKAIIILKNPSTLQVQAFVCNTLPFGSTASVLHFNRVSLLLQRVMWELCLISACYYDDFPSTMPAMLGEGSDNIVHTAMQLLGYDMSVEKETWAEMKYLGDWVRDRPKCPIGFEFLKDV